MEIKFKKKLQDYKYILAFDLAKHKSGWSFINIEEHKIVDTGDVITDKNDIMPWNDFYNKVYDVIKGKKQEYKDAFFITKERLPNQGGPHSSIDALQELAKAHAVFDLVTSQSGVDCYDYIGVHAVSVKAYVRGKYEIEKPQKKDVFACMRISFPEWEPQDCYDYDVSDSIAVAETLLNKKWNADIDLIIKESKKELKALKSDKAKNKIQEDIKFYTTLKKEA